MGKRSFHHFHFSKIFKARFDDFLCLFPLDSSSGMILRIMLWYKTRVVELLCCQRPSLLRPNVIFVRQLRMTLFPEDMRITITKEIKFIWRDVLNLLLMIFFCSFLYLFFCCAACFFFASIFSSAASSSSLYSLQYLRCITIVRIRSITYSYLIHRNCRIISSSQPICVM